MQENLDRIKEQSGLRKEQLLAFSKDQVWVEVCLPRLNRLLQDHNRQMRESLGKGEYHQALIHQGWVEALEMFGNMPRILLKEEKRLSDDAVV